MMDDSSPRQLETTVTPSVINKIPYIRCVKRMLGNVGSECSRMCGECVTLCQNEGCSIHTLETCIVVVILLVHDEAIIINRGDEEIDT